MQAGPRNGKARTQERPGLTPNGGGGSVTKRVAAHPGELLQRSRLAGVVESEHQDAELFAVLLEVPEEREQPLHGTPARGDATSAILRVYGSRQVCVRAMERAVRSALFGTVQVQRRFI